MEWSFVVLIGMVVVGIAWAVLVQPRWNKKLEAEEKQSTTEKQLAEIEKQKKMMEFVDYAVRQGVDAAEQMYKAAGDDAKDERNKIAMDYALDLIRTTKVIPEEYLGIVYILIEAKVLRLPKTSSK